MSTAQRVLVTGAAGFVGQALCARLSADGLAITALVRSPVDLGPLSLPGVVVHPPTELDDRGQLPAEVLAVDTVIHLAAKVHVMRAAATIAEEHDRINHRATLHLARQAARSGVRRFIYLSSIKVNGERTCAQPFSAEQAAGPSDSYARSKYDAEQGLLKLAAEVAMEVVIIRPPLVYGPGVKANFAQLMRLAGGNIPLPFAAIKNRRSLVSVDNLCDLIGCCINHPAAANQVFLVSDGEAISTAVLSRRLAQAAGCKGWQFYVPVSLLRWAGRLTGKGAAISRLTENLEIDISKTERLLGWTPPYPMAHTLRLMYQPTDRPTDRPHR